MVDFGVSFSDRFQQVIEILDSPKTTECLNFFSPAIRGGLGICLANSGVVLVVDGLYKCSSAILDECSKSANKKLKTKNVGSDFPRVVRSGAQATAPNENKESCSRRVSKAAGEIILGMGLLVAGGVLLHSVYKSMNARKQQIPPPAPHDYEVQVEKLLGREAMELNSEDPKPKLLFLQSSEDRSGAFNPEVEGLGKTLIELSKSHDVRYKVISQGSDVCSEIRQAAKMGNLKSLVIGAHGNPHSIELAGRRGIILFFERSFDGVLDDLEWNKECFSGLTPDAEITLLSCSTGNSPIGFAASLAKRVDRKVWSPKDDTAVPLTRFYKEQVPAQPAFYSASDFRDFREGKISEDQFAGKQKTCLSLPDGTHTCGARDWFSKLVAFRNDVEALLDFVKFW